MINLWEVLMLVVGHWFADFVCQTDRQALGKSKEWSPLLEHTLTYTVIMTFMVAFITCPQIGDKGVLLAFLFGIITFAAHTATDYYTSRVNAVLWQEEKRHDFFVSVGFDQVLHYAQLFITYFSLKAWLA